MKKHLMRLMVLSVFLVLTLNLWAGGQREAPAEKAVEIRVMFAGCVHDIEEQNAVMGPWVEKYPNIKIVYEPVPEETMVEKLYSQIAAGTAPDIFLTDIPYLEYALNGRLLDLTPYMERDKVFEWPNIVKDAFEAFKIKGKYYALPSKNMVVWGIYYNKDLLAESGVAEPQTGWSWEDFVAIGQKVTKDVDGDKRIDQWGTLHQWINQPHPVLTYMWVGANGGSFGLLDENELIKEHQFTDPATMEAYQFYMDMVTKYGICPDPQTKPTEGGFTFEQGKVALYQYGTFLTARLERANIPFDFGFVEIPKGPSAGNNYMLASGSPPSVILAGTEHPEEAWKFLSWWAGPEGIKAYHETYGMSAVPTTASDELMAILASDVKFWDTMVNLLNTGYTQFNVDLATPSKRVLAGGGIAGEWESRNHDILSRVYSGDLTVEEALTKLEQELNEFAQDVNQF